MKLSFKRNQGLETVFAETRHIELHPEVVSFFFENGIVRVTPRDGEWDSEDLNNHFLLAGFPKKYELEEDDPHYPKLQDISDKVCQVIWWDEDEQRCAVIAKSLWDLTK